jgi:alpha-beta hydrolase superfamily lysophospholipase
MPSQETFEFIGSQGATLCGQLHRPDAPARGSILLAHCFTCSKDLHTMTRLANGLSDAGYAALRFDFTGLGESGGDFASTTVSANVTDLTRAAASLIEQGFGPCGLVGHSLGGAASILAASRLKTVASLITLAAPSNVRHVRRLFDESAGTLASQGRATVSIGGRSFELEQGFVDDLERHDVLGAVASLGRPYLVVHAKDDSVVGFEHGVALHMAANEPKRLVALEQGDHLFASRDSAEQVLGAVLDWFGETLDRSHQTGRSSPP